MLNTRWRLQHWHTYLKCSSGFQHARDLLQRKLELDDVVRQITFVQPLIYYPTGAYVRGIIVREQFTLTLSSGIPRAIRRTWLRINNVSLIFKTGCSKALTQNRTRRHRREVALGCPVCNRYPVGSDTPYTYKFACIHVTRHASIGSISSRFGCRGTISRPTLLALHAIRQIPGLSTYQRNVYPTPDEINGR